MTIVSALPETPIPVKTIMGLTSQSDRVTAAIPVVATDQGTSVVDNPCLAFYFETDDTRVILGFDTTSEAWTTIEETDPGTDFNVTGDHVLDWIDRYAGLQYGEPRLYETNKPTAPKFLHPD